MTKPSAMLQLGKAIAKDLTRGESSSGMQDLGEALVSNPDSALEVVELLFAESRKKRPRQDLIAAFCFMIERALETARWRTENQSLWANDLIDRLRSSILRAAEQDERSATVLIAIAQTFAAAKVDMGDELRQRIALAASRDSEGVDTATAIAAEFENMLGRLAEELEHDPFLIHAQISGMLDYLPVAQRIQMLAVLASFDAPSLREAMAGWLLDADASVGNAVAGFLAHAATNGLVSGATVNRLVVIRNWVNNDRRSAIDAVIRAARQKGVGLAVPTSPIQIAGVVASSCDGAGAQSFFVVIRQKRKHSIASLLVKHGFGVRDAWVRAGLTGAEAETFVDQVGFELGGFDSSLDVVKTALAHGLAANIETGEPIPFGLVQFIEATGLSFVPAYLKPRELLDQLLADIHEEKKNPAAVARALSSLKRWQKEQHWLDSWFEDSEEALQAARGGKTSKTRTENILHNVVGAHRQRWAERLAWTALAARDETDNDEWIEFALVAGALLGDRPIEEIPLARRIAQNTAEALKGV